MATHRLFVPAIAFLPDTSGNVYPKPSSIDDANDAAPHEILAFKDSGTRILAYTTFAVPKNYVGTPKLIVSWRTTATTGNVVVEVDTKAVADGESMDPASLNDDNGTSTVAVPGTAGLRKDTSFTLTGTYAADDIVQLAVARDGAQNSGNDDTLAAEWFLEGVFFEYADA